MSPNLYPDIDYIPNFIPEIEVSEVFNILFNELQWHQGNVRLFGKWIAEPRLMVGYGEKPYTYSGKTMPAQPFHPLILRIKNDIEFETGYFFNTALINLYRDGKDSMGWHADNEPELGSNPVIASLSLGASRWFHFRHRQIASVKHKICLESGSLLLMKGATQHYWLHALPKSAKVSEPRINITFRLVKV